MQAPAPRLVAEDDVLEHGEVVGQHEVLVHHADAGRDGVGGAAEVTDLAVDARSCPRRGAASRRGSSSASTCRRRSRRRWRGSCPARTRRFTSRLATTPGNRLTIPVSSTAGSRLRPTRRLAARLERAGDRRRDRRRARAEPGTPWSEVGATAQGVGGHLDLAVDDLLLESSICSCVDDLAAGGRVVDAVRPSGRDDHAGLERTVDELA